MAVRVMLFIGKSHRSTSPNRGAVLAELRRTRMPNSPAILRGGFRPFFLGGAAWALAGLVLWLMALSGAMTLPAAVDALSWHRHEMLFGFVGAVIAGFLLAAIPNWTGRLPIAGAPLAGLFGLWLAGRAAMLFSGRTGLDLAAALDVGFFFILAGLGAREVLAARNRNMPVVGLVLLFGIANALDYAALAGAVDDTKLGIRAGIGLVTVMISLIGGRIIPSFTRNCMMKQGLKERLPDQPGRFDLIAITATAAAMLAWVSAPESRTAGMLLVLAGLLQALRLSRWGGLRTISDPLVFILHVAYGWLPAGLLLLGFSLLGTYVPASAAIHALTAGAMASMILAVMTRATLGHTGRALAANRATVILYVLVTLGALLRVAAPFGLVDYTQGMRLSAILWGGAFLLFIIAYGPMLASARVGDSSK
jgi:uncharacterized protein involved in response to NO